MVDNLNLKPNTSLPQEVDDLLRLQLYLSGLQQKFEERSRKESGHKILSAVLLLGSVLAILAALNPACQDLFLEKVNSIDPQPIKDFFINAIGPHVVNLLTH